MGSPQPRGPPRPRPPGAWAVLFGAFLQGALVFGGVRAVGLCLRPIGGAMGAGAGTVAWVGSAPLAALQVGGPLGIALSSRLGVRPVAMVGGLLAGGGLLLAAFATHISHLCLSAGLMAGLGWSFIFTPSLAALRLFFPSCRSAALGVAVSGASVSGLALGPLVPFLMDTYGWRGTLLLLAALSFNLLAAAALLRPPPPPPSVPPHPSPPGFLRLLRHRPFLRYAAAIALLDLGYYVPFIHGESFAHRSGYGDRASGMLMAAMMAADGAGRVASGWAGSRWGAPLPRQLCLWGCGAGLLLLLWPLGGARGALPALAAAYGLCAGGVAPLQIEAAAEVAAPGAAAAAVGLLQLLESGGSAAGAPLAGWLRDTTGSFTCSFLLASAFVLTGALLLLTLSPKGEGPLPAPPGPSPPPHTVTPIKVNVNTERLP